MPLTEIDRLRYLFDVYGLRRGTITKSWRDPAVLNLSGLKAPPVSGVYPLDFAQDDTPELLTDAAGIPMIDYASLGRQYNPWFIGHIALGRFSRWAVTLDDSILKGFRQLADWFVANAEPQPVGVAWVYRFDWLGGHDAPWISGISQAHGISTLLRAATVFKNDTYARVAWQATEMMLAPLEEGGTAVNWPDGTVSLEESVRLPATAILNGHLFSVFAAWEAGQYFQETRYLETASRGWTFVRNRIDCYDLGYWSCYSLKTGRSGLPDIASPHYHGVHIAQFRVVAAITGDLFFAEVADRFERYHRDPALRRKAIWKKRLTKLIDR